MTTPRSILIPMVGVSSNPGLDSIPCRETATTGTCGYPASRRPLRSMAA